MSDNTIYLHSLQRHHLVLALIVLLLALISRLAFVATYPVSPLAGHDPIAFWSFAEGIAASQGFRSTFEPWLADRPPLYSYFMAGVFLLFGQSHSVVFITQAVLGAIAASLFYLVGVRVLGSGRGLLAGILFALFPHFLVFTKQILTEALYIPLLVAVLASLILTKGAIHSRSGWILTGLLLGLVTLVRREAILPAGLMVALITYLRIRPNWGQLARAWVWIVLIAGLTLTPWLARNWQLLGKPMLSSSGGINFMVGNNPEATGGYTVPSSEWMTQFEGLDELARNDKAWELSLGWVRSHPDDFLRLLPRKLVVLWGPSRNPVLDAVDLILVVFILSGFVRLARRQGNWQMVAAIALPLILCVTLIGLVFVGGWRYRHAVYPGLLLLAAYGVPESWLEWLRQVLQASKLKVAPHSPHG